MARVENSELIDFPAYADNYERSFCYSVQSWGAGGGVATLVPSEGGRVYGSAVQLTSEEIQKLDSYEGLYHKENIVVSILIDDAGSDVGMRWAERTAIVYLADNPLYITHPSEQYLTAIHIMLREHFDPEHEALTIHIRGLIQVGDDRVLIHVNTWNHPGVASLSLSSLCVEVNSIRATKWVMPLSMRNICAALSHHGVTSAAQFAVLISSQNSAKVDDINRYLEEIRSNVKLDEETMNHFRQLLCLE